MDISRQAKELETLIENLPPITQAPEEQTQNLELLAQENDRATEDYEAAVLEAKKLLQEVTQALREIAMDQSHT